MRSFDHSSDELCWFDQHSLALRSEEVWMYVAGHVKGMAEVNSVYLSVFLRHLCRYRCVWDEGLMGGFLQVSRLSVACRALRLRWKHEKLWDLSFRLPGGFT